METPNSNYLAPPKHLIIQTPFPINRDHNYSPGTGASLDYDNFILNGIVQLIPEPGAMSLAAVGTLVFLAIGFRKAKSEQAN